MTGRILIAGTSSGSGKTSITCGLLRALQNRGLNAAACKCGPDYIDPMFHRDVVGAPSRNLDLFLCDENTVRTLLAGSCAHSDVTVIEGVMGFYDGLAGTATASSYHLAQATGTPVVLVADCKGKSLSLAAEILGYSKFRENSIAAILLNRCVPRSYPMLKEIVERHTGLPVLGYLPYLKEMALESRHLGLVTAGEVADLQDKINLLAEQISQTVDIPRLLEIAAGAEALAPSPAPVTPVARGVRIAVARDAAFCFTYQDNLDLLALLGADIVPFSPLEDGELPPDVHGLLLSGGYPELYLDRLAANRPLLGRVREAVEGGMPCIGECGGFMLLCRSITALDGGKFDMAGVLPTDVKMTRRLSPFGYITLTARQDNLLCAKGEKLRAHEFHYSEADNPGDGFLAQKAGGAGWDCIHTSDTLFAGYPHLHLWGCPGAAERFVRRCAHYKEATP